ncbi:hypothetical protein L7F22_037068 [Adiantum nelumboides]|nr:hypothetical protein [Adiantum nelumboides]
MFSKGSAVRRWVALAEMAFRRALRIVVYAKGGRLVMVVPESTMVPPAPVKADAADADALEGYVVVVLQGKIGVADERSEDGVWGDGGGEGEGGVGGGEHGGQAIGEGAGVATLSQLRGEGEGAGAQAEHAGGAHKAAGAAGAAAKGHVGEGVAGVQRESVGDEGPGGARAVVICHLVGAQVAAAVELEGIVGEAPGGGGNGGAKRGAAGDVAVSGRGCGVEDGRVQLLEAGVAGLALDPREVAARVHDHVHIVARVRVKAAAHGEAGEVAAGVDKLEARADGHICCCGSSGRRTAGCFVEAPPTLLVSLKGTPPQVELSPSLAGEGGHGRRQMVDGCSRGT